MKHDKTTNRGDRHPERGSVTIIVACLLTTLFAFAALAVDMGFRYTKSRMLQAVADSAVTAGMPSMVSGNTTTANSLAVAMAKANGYSGNSQVVVDSTSVVGQLKVTTKASAPSFFSAIFGGGSSRLMSGTAIGQVTGSNGPALLALGNCSSNPGLNLQGVGALTIKGNIESNAPITFSTGGGASPQTDSGSVQSYCGAPNVISGTITYTGAGVLPTATSLFPDPFSADTTALLGTYCTVGNLATNQDIQYSAWTETDTVNNIWTLTPGVYCSSGNMTLSGPGVGFIANNVTVVSLGQVVVGATSTVIGSVLTAYSGFPSNLAVYAGYNGAGPAINLGSNNLTVNGSVYAPQGLAALSGQTGMTLNGSVVGQDVQIGDNGDWTFNPNGATGATTWRMYQ